MQTFDKETLSAQLLHLPACIDNEYAYFQTAFFYNILGRCFATYSVITGYLLTSFCHNFLAVKTLLFSLQNIT